MASSAFTKHPNTGPHPPGKRHWSKPYRTEIAASLSTIASTLGASPADVVKTQMQSYNFASTLACVKHIYYSEGLKGFWRGSTAPLASITLVKTMTFSAYQKAKYRISETIGRATGGEEPLVTVNRPGSIPNLATLACFGGAGMFAGAATSVVGCPFELTKLFAQISLGELPAGAFQKKQVPANDAIRKSYQSLGAFRTAMNIVRLRGVLGLWSGFRLHVLREALGTGIYFMTYESAKQLLVKYQKKDSPTAPLSVTLAGGVSGLVSWALVSFCDCEQKG